MTSDFYLGMQGVATELLDEFKIEKMRQRYSARASTVFLCSSVASNALPSAKWGRSSLC